MSVLHLSDQRVDSQLRDEVNVHLGRSSEELSADVEVRVDPPSSIQEVLSYVDRSGVTVVDTEPGESELGERGSVLFHVLPKERIVGRLATVAKLDTVTPGDDLPTKVDSGFGRSEVREWIGSPDPSVVG